MEGTFQDLQAHGLSECWTSILHVYYGDVGWSLGDYFEMASGLFLYALLMSHLTKQSSLPFRLTRWWQKSTVHAAIRYYVGFLTSLHNVAHIKGTSAYTNR